MIPRQNYSLGSFCNKALLTAKGRTDRGIYKGLLRQLQRGMTADEAMLAILKVMLTPKPKHKVEVKP